MAARWRIMDDAIVADIRAFNRFYTRLIGLLDAGMHESPFSLPEARLIYEIGRARGAGHRELAQLLGLDPGYLTRLNYKLIDAGMIASARSMTDRRVSNYALTREGEAVFAQLDHGSNVAAETLIAPLDAAQRLALVKAMRTISSLLGEPKPATPVVLRPHRIGELGWLIHRQGMLYNQQYGWNGEFEALIAGLYRDFEALPSTPPKALWIADRGGSVVGSVYVVPADGQPGVAQLRMLYVEPEARGQGLGATLVEQAVSFARGAGYRRLILWTQSVLVPARRIYAASGFTLERSAPHHSFGQDLVGETWGIAL
jgi:DNA-binding MarR family transcriptional regulator/GNAT superfamily N-acetyltransferase